MRIYLTKAEYDEINGDFKGDLPDGTPSILRLVPGIGTCIVPVEIDKTPAVGQRVSYLDKISQINSHGSSSFKRGVIVSVSAFLDRAIVMNDSESNDVFAVFKMIPVSELFLLDPDEDKYGNKISVEVKPTRMR